MVTHDNELETYYHQMQLPAGNLHVYASSQLYHSFDYKIFEMANNNLQIPHNLYMSYTPDVHVGVGTCIGTTAIWPMDKGYVSPSIVGSDIGCGMRVHLTNLHRDDLLDVKLRKKLVKTIEKYLPVEEHSRGHYSDIRLEHVICKGLSGLPKKYVPDSYTPRKATSLDRVECSKYSFDQDYLDRLPESVWHRSHRQLGSLGNGNHFAEIQSLRIHEENRSVAEQWGLVDGQIVVMIHSGSRAWGGAVNHYSASEIAKTMRLHGLGTADPKLTYAPIDSAAGQAYMHLMHSALNYAVVNRHLIAYSIREAFQELFGPKFEMTTLYDLMHNYALEEQHRDEAVLVHRKGTTRALPPHHPDNPEFYRATGHPALIPGSMGTASYIMVGRQEGERNYHSICHGAGRIRSRSATKRLVTLSELTSALRVGSKDEIVVNPRMMESLIDESPQAYKDVDQIIDSVVGAGLADIVAKCKPMAVVKGV